MICDQDSSLIPRNAEGCALKCRATILRLATTRNSLSQGRDRDGPFLQAPAFATRTIFLTPRRLLPLWHSSESPPPFRNPLGDCIQVSLSLDARVTMPREQREAALR